MKRPGQISKILSANDAGETGAHQAGILIQKSSGVVSFFPDLDPEEYNPRVHLFFADAAGERWEFAFIYYNNRLHGRGTRNEYRLTRMTPYFHRHNLKPGDEIISKRSERDHFSIGHHRKNQPVRTAGGVLRLSAGWKIIDI
ncbi:EcoRII N-terminal effector-binding domain-containing protein [Bradyrhizobium sp. BR 1433]|uniref:EcoRII N-terminal effector-binding domain-containing protein n=1 Tax=Bradyrhizobium sp. BR 1433 TaxID=3447967 RepID=UPI003EE44D95